MIERMNFKTLRTMYLSRIDRISICDWKTRNYENFRFPQLVPPSYDNFSVRGIGLITSEFYDEDGNLDLLPCIEIMVMKDELEE